MVSRDIKTTWELAGNLSSSFTNSTKKAQTELSRLRTEYRAGQAELKRLQDVMRLSERGTANYVNASRRIPELQESLAAQALEINAVQREVLGLGEAQTRMGSATARAGAAMRRLTPFALAAGSAIGIAAGAVAALTSQLNASAREAQALQTLSIRGIDTTAYQQAGNTLKVLTGDAAAAERAVAGIAQSGQETREALAFDPRRLGVDFRRGVSELGFGSPQEFAEATSNADRYFGHLRDLVALAEGDQLRLDRLRAAVGAVGQDQALVDSAIEYNRLLERRGDLIQAAARGDEQAAAQLAQVERRLGRLRSDAGILTPQEIDQLEQYSEATEDLKLAVRGLKQDLAIGFGDEATAAIDGLATAVRETAGWLDENSQRREGFAEALNESARQRVQATAERRAGIAEAFSPRIEVNQTPLQQAFAAALNDAAASSVDRRESARKGFAQALAGYADGGIVPGPRGRPQLAVVHGGERVLTEPERRQYAGGGGRQITQNNTFYIDGSQGMMQAGEDIAAILARQLAEGSRW